MSNQSTDIIVVGAGNTGIATAYYLAELYGITNVLLIDAGQPMAFTSAQSGENYRNWWPHPSMVSFTNRSIDLMEKISCESNNRINMNRRGYALSTRNANIDDLLEQLRAGLGDATDDLLRFHSQKSTGRYEPPIRPEWETAPIGVDILQDRELIRKNFPSYDPEVNSVIHIRRGGDFSGQQLGMHMLEACREWGIKRLTGTVEDIKLTDHYEVSVSTSEGVVRVEAEKIVNAAGPFADKIAKMLNFNLPIYNTFQQKIAFEDKAKAIPRDMPFSIDLDSQKIDWSEDELKDLESEDEFRWLTKEILGAIHCRPDGGDNGSWVKLGWAYNQKPEEATWEPPLCDYFPEIVLRGAARLNPSLKSYYDRLPRNTHHYGGWYTMTDENWPLIGPMGSGGAFMNCAMSGFGTMTACSAGELCAAWVADASLPAYAKEFSLERYDNKVLMEHLLTSNKGIL